jgi:iron complex outermembrane receptor protein
MANKCSHRKIIFYSVYNLIIIFSSSLKAQDTLKSPGQSADTIINRITPINLGEVEITAYPLLHPEFRHPSSTEHLNKKEINSVDGESVTQLVNRKPGIRMEERSPGSYRFSIRGSLLRSPFGIRNIKFYIDNYPFTDGGGNTYLNILDKNSFQSISILKGPEGSFFGANTGGTVILNTSNINDSDKINLSIFYSSFNTLYSGANATLNSNKSHSEILISSYLSEGYRIQSKMQRLSFFISHNIKLNHRDSIGLIGLLSKINYETPGGLNLMQADSNPEMARPASGNFRGAEDQKAGIENITFLGGVSLRRKVGPKGVNKTNLSFSHTEFKNPFITNFETRTENTVSARIFLQNYLSVGNKEIQWTVGGEGQVTQSEIKNYGNRFGEKDTIQSSDLITYEQGFAFTGLSMHLFEKLLGEFSSSINGAFLSYNSNLDTIPKPENRIFPFQFVPRISLIYFFTDHANIRISAAKGYSLPTLSEIRPSTNIISKTLNPEYGWNYEAGLRIRNHSGKWSLSLTAFYFRLNDAIVRRIDPDDNEYFVNAGGTLQPGVEIAFNLVLYSSQNNLLRNISISSSFTNNKFSFTNYSIGEKDFSNNKLTGVPEDVVSNELNFTFSKEIKLSFYHYYCGELPLNDDNSIFADSYNIFNVRVEKTFSLKRIQISFKGEARNILNEFYSSGNDLNAAGGRYYNPAALRNYMAGLEVRF